MTGLAIGSIKARDKISEVVVVIVVVIKKNADVSTFCNESFIQNKILQNSLSDNLYSSSGEDKTFRTWLLDTFVLVYFIFVSD